jgi:hypothetical protein
MPEFESAMLVKIFMAILVFALLMSIKSVALGNIESYGLTPLEQGQFMRFWSDFKGDYLFILVSIIISMAIGLKFNFKAE